MICEARNPSQCTAPKCDCGKLPDSGSALAPDTEPVAWRIEPSWGGWVYFETKRDGADFAGSPDRLEPLYPASALTTLSATVEQLRKELEAMTTDRDETLRAATGMSAEVNAFADRAEAAERQLSELTAVLRNDLNVTDQELLRIRNECERESGGYLIWSKMLQQFVDTIRHARAALSLREEE